MSYYIAHVVSHISLANTLHYTQVLSMVCLAGASQSWLWPKKAGYARKSFQSAGVSQVSICLSFQ